MFASDAIRTGGCLCGAVRYRLLGYSDTGYCHCATCRKSTGSPVAAWALAGADQLQLTAGVPAQHATSASGARCFCAACGTPLYARLADERGYSVNIATLDEPEKVTPMVHRCVESQLPWLKMNDLLPAYEGSEVPPLEERVYYRTGRNLEITRDSAISLHEVTAQTLLPILVLDVTGAQRRFVALNKTSLAQALFAPGVWYRGVFAEEVAVGFAMMKREEEDLCGLPTEGDPFLWRFMIDEHYQGLGFGRRAMALVTAEAASWKGARSLWTSCVEGAGSPHGFYCGLGFAPTGVRDEDGEVLLRLPL